MTGKVEQNKGRTPSPPSFYKPEPAEIKHGHMRFLITDRPSDFSMQQFIEQLRRHNAKVVVRVCEPSYRTEPLQDQGIQVFDWEFNDGCPPPHEIRDRWIHLVAENFKDNEESCIAVHCIAGLGRAPVLVALALMEAGMKYEDAVEIIRKERRGAINQKQLDYLEKYKSGGRLKKLSGDGKRHNGKDCRLM